MPVRSQGHAALGVDYAQTARRRLDEALAAAALDESQISRAVSTGYGRDNVAWVSGKMTEIACHGKGAYHFYRTALTVIDIGAQDCKVIHLDAAGVHGIQDEPQVRGGNRLVPGRDRVSPRPVTVGSQRPG